MNRLAIILIVSAILRLILVAQGGQYFFGDEERYNRGIELYLGLRAGEAEALKTALGRPEHVGFVFLGAGVTAIQHLCAKATGHGDWDHRENIRFTMKFAAGVLSLSSVVNIALVYAIMRSLGGSTGEALCSAGCLALANSGFYYSRHLLPYDSAITMGLAAILVGMRSPHARWPTSLATGVLAAATYHVYNGYWYVVPMIYAIHLGANGCRSWLCHSAGFAIGLGTAGVIPVLAGLTVKGLSYWETTVAFSKTVNFGSYAEGWRLPWEYFAHVERLFGAILAAIILASIVIARVRQEPLPKRAKILLLAATLGYCLLVLFSNGLEKFVVYARTLKPLLVIFCGVGGWALNHIFDRWPQWRVLGFTTLGALGISNLLPHYAFTFPAQAEIATMRNFGNPKRTLSFSGSIYIPVDAPVTRPDLVLVNAQMLYPLRQPLSLPKGTVVFSLPHPLNYKPFQYECHSPRERSLLRTNPPMIQLLKLSDPAVVPNDLPLPLRYTASDRPTGRE